MLYDMETTTRISDMHGEACPVCADAPCVTNIYLLDEDGDGETRHTCADMTCIEHTLSVHHYGDETALVEVSTAALPWEDGGFTAPVLALDYPVPAAMERVA